MNNLFGTPNARLVRRRVFNWGETPEEAETYIKAIRHMSAAILTMIGVVMASQVAQAQTEEHLDELAIQLQSQVRRLSRGLRSNYRHTSQYRHLSRDTAEMSRLASHVHEAVHDGDLDHLHDDLHELDDSLQHVRELVADIEHESSHDDHGDRRGGHTQGDPRQIRRMLSAVENTLHHLLDDVEHLPSARVQGDDEHDHDEVQRGPAPSVRRGSNSRDPGARRGFQIRIGG